MLKTLTTRTALAALLVLSLSARASATTWAPAEVECPVCKTKNTFLEVMSYGSYIYSWPSKYQLVFWPLIDSPVLYSCKNCRLTAFMWDFREVPKEKHAEMRKQLAGFKLEPAKGGGDDHSLMGGVKTPYTAIPMTDRLAAAEKVYEMLGRDDEFWCRFYRVVGYHAEAEKRQPQADEARRKALARAELMLADKANAGLRKELLYITGAMRFLLKDEPGALKDFREALALKYENKKLEAARNASYDEYLTTLLREYLQKLEEPQKPEAKKAA